MVEWYRQKNLKQIKEITQLGDNYSYLFNFRQNICKSLFYLLIKWILQRLWSCLLSGVIIPVFNTDGVVYRTIVPLELKIRDNFQNIGSWMGTFFQKACPWRN